MTERITAWQCIGCGRIECEQPCIGICEDRRTQFVYAADHDAVLAQMERLRQQAEALAMVVRQIACITPREGQCERAWRVLQARARQALEASSNGQSRSA